MAVGESGLVKKRGRCAKQDKEQEEELRRSLWQRLETVLANYLTPDELHALRDLTGSRCKLPFQYDPESRRFEIGDSWLVDLTEWEELGEATGGLDPLFSESAMDAAVDLLCRACDVLNEHQEEIEVDLFRRPAEGGEFTFRFVFSAGEDKRDSSRRDEKTGLRFEQLVRQAARLGRAGEARSIGEAGPAGGARSAGEGGFARWGKAGFDGRRRDWKVETETHAGERVVLVTVYFRTEEEFGSQKDELYWLLDLAERQQHNRPFVARRVW